jgi:tetratricopeptide (TPR) repeat protein
MDSSEEKPDYMERIDAVLAAKTTVGAEVGLDSDGFDIDNPDSDDEIRVIDDDDNEMETDSLFAAQRLADWKKILPGLSDTKYLEIVSDELKSLKRQSDAADDEDEDYDDEVDGDDIDHEYNDNDDDVGADIEDDDDDDGELTLGELCTFISEVQTTVSILDQRLKSHSDSKREINTILGELAKQYGFLEDMQFELDGLSLTSAEEKAQRKEATATVEALFSKLAEVEEACEASIKTLSGSEREKGNEAFKSGSFQQAIIHYSEAISIDPTGHVAIYTNRALAYQKLGRFSEALADSRAAIKMDCNFLKVKYFRLSCISSSLKFYYVCSCFTIYCIGIRDCIKDAFKYGSADRVKR